MRYLTFLFMLETKSISIPRLKLNMSVIPQRLSHHHLKRKASRFRD